MSFQDTVKTAFNATKTRVKAFIGDDKPVIPVVRLEGVITAGGRNGSALNLQRVEKLLDKAFGMSDAPAVALVINSPGGSPVQSRLIHERIRALAAEKDKPVLVFCEDVCASGGYFIAVAGDEIFVDPATIIGSIGVIMAGFGFQEAIEKLGVERRVKTAGASKSLSDPFIAETEAQKAVMDRLMTGLHRQFIDLVKSRRDDKFTTEAELFDGSVFSGEEAVENGLADHVGNVRTVLRDRYGEDVKFKPMSPAKPSPIGRLMGAALDQVELRAVWARFGL